MFLTSHEHGLRQRQVPSSQCPQGLAGRGAAADGPRKMLPMGNKIKTWQGERQDGQAAAPIGNDNPQSGLCKANTPVKVALPAPHIFREGGSISGAPKEMPIRGDYPLSPRKPKGQ